MDDFITDKKIVLAKYQDTKTDIELLKLDHSITKERLIVLEKQ